MVILAADGVALSVLVCTGSGGVPIVVAIIFPDVVCVVLSVVVNAMLDVELAVDIAK